jgi:hypothetical protein
MVVVTAAAMAVMSAGESVDAVGGAVVIVAAE